MVPDPMGGGRWPPPGAWSALLAGGLPFVAYVATASGFGYWLDAGEFVAASIDLGVSHPPGHPLAALVGHAFTALPLGPLPFRVALAGATAAALAAVCLERALRGTLGAVWPLAPPMAVRWLAVSGTWLAAASVGWWFQAVRPEVYALQALLALFALERLVALERAYPEDPDPRRLWLAALAVGLALANHHFLAILLLPAMAPAAARLVRARGPRVLGPAVGAGALGLAVYAYLPLRAARAPTPNLGDPADLARFAWVVSARAYQGNAGSGVPQPMGERFADVAVALVEHLHVGVVLLAAVGLYVLLRGARTRAFGVLWALVLAVHVGARAWLGFVRSNPDAWGYLMPAYAALAVLATAAVAAMLSFLPRGRRVWRLAAAGVALATLAVGPWQLARGADGASLARFRATDVLLEAQYRALPPSSVVVAHDPGTVFGLWGAEASERLRPDLTLVPMPFLGYPGTAEALVRAEPRLRGLLRQALLEGQLDAAELQGLAGARPVFVELDVRVPQALYRTLVPAAVLHRALSDEALDDDRTLGAAAAARAWRRVYRRIEPLPEASHETRMRLLWRHYTDALYFVGVGMTEPARRAVALGLRIAPEAPELRVLERELSAGPLPGPMDVSPLLRMTTAPW